MPRPAAAPLIASAPTGDRPRPAAAPLQQIISASVTFAIADTTTTALQPTLPPPLHDRRSPDASPSHPPPTSPPNFIATIVCRATLIRPLHAFQIKLCPDEGSGSFVACIPLRDGAPIGRKQKTVPTNGRATRSFKRFHEVTAPRAAGQSSLLSIASISAFSSCGSGSPANRVVAKAATNFQSSSVALASVCPTVAAIPFTAHPVEPWLWPIHLHLQIFHRVLRCT